MILLLLIKVTDTISQKHEKLKQKWTYTICFCLKIPSMTFRVKLSGITYSLCACGNAVNRNL